MELPPIAEVISLNSKTAIVTGGAMGIGYGIAYRLAEAGAAVVIADIDEAVGNRASETLTRAGFRASFIRTDVADGESVQSCVARTRDTYGSLDILINNAGIFPNASMLTMDTAMFERILDVNLRGVFAFTKVAANAMIEAGKGGKIINITSIDALHPSMVGLAAYDASKHGVWGFTKNTALELAPHNIQVNAIAPGGITTPGTGAGTVAEDALASFAARIPMGRMGMPDDIGKAALFLASDMASYMTGSQVVVDGGYLLR